MYFPCLVYFTLCDLREKILKKQKENQILEDARFNLLIEYLTQHDVLTLYQELKGDSLPEALKIQYYHFYDEVVDMAW